MQKTKGYKPSSAGSLIFFAPEKIDCRPHKNINIRKLVIQMKKSIKIKNVTYNKKTGILDIANGEIIDMNSYETKLKDTNIRNNKFSEKLFDFVHISAFFKCFV